MVTNLQILIIHYEGKKYYSKSKDHYGESKQWHERPVIVKSNFKSSLCETMALYR